MEWMCKIDQSVVGADEHVKTSKAGCTGRAMDRWYLHNLWFTASDDGGSRVASPPRSERAKKWVMRIPPVRAWADRHELDRVELDKVTA